MDRVEGGQRQRLRTGEKRDSDAGRLKSMKSSKTAKSGKSGSSRVLVFCFVFQFQCPNGGVFLGMALCSVFLGGISGDTTPTNQFDINCGGPPI